MPSRRCQWGGRDRLWNTQNKRSLPKSPLCDEPMMVQQTQAWALGLSLQPPLLLMSQERVEVLAQFKSELPDPRARCWLCMKTVAALKWSECCPYWGSFKGQRSGGRGWGNMRGQINWSDSTSICFMFGGLVKSFSFIFFFFFPSLLLPLSFFLSSLL